MKNVEIIRFPLYNFKKNSVQKKDFSVENGQLVPIKRKNKSPEKIRNFRIKNKKIPMKQVVISL